MGGVELPGVRIAIVGGPSHPGGATECIASPSEALRPDAGLPDKVLEMEIARAARLRRL